MYSYSIWPLRKEMWLIWKNKKRRSIRESFERKSLIQTIKLWWNFPTRWTWRAKSSKTCAQVHWKKKLPIYLQDEFYCSWFIVNNHIWFHVFKSKLGWFPEKKEKILGNFTNNSIKCYNEFSSENSWIWSCNLDVDILWSKNSIKI